MAAPVSDSLATRLRQVRRSARAASGTSTRSLMGVAFVNAAIALAVAIVVSVVALAAAGGDLGGVAATISVVWLALHQVPVSIAEVTLGVLPLLPTIGLVAIVARSVRRHVAADPDDPEANAGRDVLSVAAAAIGGPLLITAVALAVILDASTVSNVQSPNALGAFVGTILVHGIGVLLGLRSIWVPIVVRRLGIAPWGIRAIRIGAIGVAALLAFSAVLVAVRLIWNWETVGNLLGTGGVNGAIALALLSILYLPNVVIGTAGVLVGGDASVGSAGVNLFSAHGGQVPPLPLLAILPDGDVPALAPLLLLATFAAVGVAAWRARALDTWQNLRTVVVAAVVAATLMVVLAAVSGGQIGLLGQAGPNIPASGVFTFLWMGVVGTVVGLVYSVLPSTAAAREKAIIEYDHDDLEYDDTAADDVEADEYDDEYEDADDARESDERDADEDVDDDVIDDDDRREKATAIFGTPDDGFDDYSDERDDFAEADADLMAKDDFAGPKHRR